MNRILSISMAALLIALFTLPAAVPTAQLAVAAAQQLGEEPAALDLGIGNRTLVVDPDQIKSGLVLFSVFSRDFSDTPLFYYVQEQGASVYVVGDNQNPLPFATPIGSWGQGQTIDQVLGSWLASPSYAQPPTLVVPQDKWITANVNEGTTYLLVVTDGSTSDSAEFQVQDIAPGFPQVNAANPAGIIDLSVVGTPPEVNMDIFAGIPVYTPGSTVELVVSNLPANTTGVEVYLDFVGSRDRAVLSDAGDGTFVGELDLPEELQFGVHLIIAVIEFEIPAYPAPEQAATIAFLPIFIDAALFSGPFIIEGNAGETLTFDFRGLPGGVFIGDDIDNDGNIELAWMKEEAGGAGPYDWIVPSAIKTSELGTLVVSAELEADVAVGGAFRLYLWEDGGDSTIQWPGGVEPDPNVDLDHDGDGANDISFGGAIIVSDPDVPPGDIDPTDAGLAVYIDGVILSPTNNEILPCVSTVRVVVFNTFANATVEFYLGPFKIGEARTNSLGVAEITVVPIVPGVAGTAMDYIFHARAERSGFVDNINLDSSDYVDIVPNISYTVVPEGFYLKEGTTEWAAGPTSFQISVCGLEPEEVVDAYDSLGYSSDTAVADELGRAELEIEAPPMGPVGHTVTVSVDGQAHGPVDSFNYMHPELLALETFYTVTGTEHGIVPGTVEVFYSTDYPGDDLNGGVFAGSDTLEIFVDDATYVPDSATYRLYIGGDYIEISGANLSTGFNTVPATAPSATGVYPLALTVLDGDGDEFSAIEPRTIDFEDDPDLYFLVVSDPEGQPGIEMLYPDSPAIPAGVGAAVFAAFNLNASEEVKIWSATIIDPDAPNAEFYVFEPGGMATPGADGSWIVTSDSLGAVIFIVEDFETPETTHTLKMESQGTSNLTEIFLLDVFKYMVGAADFGLLLSPFLTPQAIGFDVNGFGVVYILSNTLTGVELEGYGFRSKGWYKVIGIDPITLQPIPGFESERFTADDDGTIMQAVDISIPIEMAIGEFAILGLLDIETGDVFFLPIVISGWRYAPGDYIFLRWTNYNVTSIDNWILTPLEEIAFFVVNVPLSPVLPSGAVVTAVGATLEFYTIDEDGNLDYEFQTIAVANQFTVDTAGSLLEYAQLVAPVPNFDASLAGEKVVIIIDQIVVQYVVSDPTVGNNVPGFAFGLENFTLGTVILSGDGGALVNLTEVLGRLDAIESQLGSIAVAINTGFETVLASLEDISGTLVEVRDGVVTIQSQIGEVQASIDDLADLISQAETNITLTVTEEANRVIGVIETSTLTLQGDHNDILAVLEGMGAILAAIQGDVAEIKTTAGTILVSVEDLQTLIGDQTDIILEAIDDQTVVLQGDLGQIKASLDALQPVITEVAEGVATMQTTLGEVKTGVDDLLEIGAEVSGVVVENNQLLATITTSVGNIQADVTTLKDLIESGVQVQLDQVLSDLQAIAEQNSQLADQANEIAQTLAAVQSQTDKITDIQSTLASVAGDVADVKQSTGDLSSKLDDVSTTLGSVESKVDSISDAVGTIQEDLAQVQDQASSASGRAQTWGIVNAVLSLAVLGVAGYLVLQLTRRE